jgi:hypothetical protein
VARGFRNLADLDCTVPGRGIAMLGANAQGKTNFLEAVYYPVLFRSFRGAPDQEVAGFGSPGFQVEASVEESGVATLAAGYLSGARRKRILLDGAEPGAPGGPVDRARGAAGVSHGAPPRGAASRSGAGGLVGDGRQSGWPPPHNMTDQRRPSPLAEALASYLRRSGFAKRIQQAGVIEAWPELVGPQIAAVTAPESVTPDGVLRVRVATAAWANELSLMTPRILARLNDGRQGRVKEIRWVPGLDRPRP